MKRLLVLLWLLSVAVSAHADPLPAARRTDWTYTGVPGGIPARTTICTTLSAGVTGAQITSAIQSCSSGGGGVVKLNAGTYTLSDTIALSSSNVTLRGAGPTQTILKGNTILRIGAVGSPTTVNIALTGGGTKDSRSFTVATTSGLSVGQMIELWRADDPDYVISTNGGSGFLRQVNLITGIAGSTITVRNPLFLDFSTGSPKILYTFFGVTSLVGVEDLKLDYSSSTSTTTVAWQYCDRCWLRNVESVKARGYHFQILGALNMEVRDSYLHEAQTYGPNNSGLCIYGNPTWGSNSSGKIENNIFDRLFPAVELQNSSSGFYMGYNYFYGSQWDAVPGGVTWTMEDSHGPQDMFNLWEGNIGEMYGADGYFGSSSHGLAFRNYVTGMNPWGGTNNPIQLKRLNYYYSLIGNVLGSPALSSTKYAETLEDCGGSCNAIYQLGYPNMGNMSLTPYDGQPPGMTFPDAKVTSTIFRWGNYDYYTHTIRWETSEVPSGVPVPSDHVLPASYYYTSKPSWFGAVAWPPIGPDVTGANGGGNGSADTSGHVNKIPAQLCWESRKLPSGSYDALVCYTASAVPQPPTNVIIR